ncbi:MAG TPA: hypothetical protein VGG25_13025 [Streptosporangiaceae bacterium]|jgi:hypothetical protein
MADDSIDEPELAQPGLDRLFATLTTVPSAAELGGEAAALEMFRASRRAAGPGAGGVGTLAAVPGGAAVPSRRARRPAVSSRVLAAAAAVVLIGGFAAAAYSAALPSPVQHVAYHVLGFIGVPDSGGSQSAPPRHVGGSGGPPPVSPAASPRATAPGTGQATSPGTGRATGSPSPGHSGSPSPGHSASPSPGQSTTPPPVPILSVGVALPKIGAGGSEQITGTATGAGGPLAGVLLRFQRHAVGHPGWHLAGTARTGQDGQASLTVTGLLVNTYFRVAGPQGARSTAVRVKVIPPVTLSAVTGVHDHRARLTASCPDAAAGNILLLQKLMQGIWQTVRTGRLGAGRKKVFVVDRASAAHRFRVVLLATVRHARSVSSPVIVPRAAA